MAGTFTPKVVVIIIMALVISSVVITFATLIPLVFLAEDDDDSMTTAMTNAMTTAMTNAMTTVTTAISNVFLDAVFNYPVPYVAEFGDNTSPQFGVLDLNITQSIQNFLTAGNLTAAVPSVDVLGFANVTQTQVTVRLETNPLLVTQVQLQALLAAQLSTFAPGSTFVSLAAAP